MSFVEDREYTFWYSEQHAQHYHKINQKIGEHFHDIRIFKNYTNINNTTTPYTACRSDGNMIEPFDEALKRFPDYRMIGTGTINNIIGTIELW